MLGAIIGDIVGSRFEWNNHRSKDFDLLTYNCFFTDDSVMSLAVAKAILESASFAKGRERYSILMTEEAFKIIQDEDGTKHVCGEDKIWSRYERV